MSKRARDELNQMFARDRAAREDDAGRDWD
jgi:hypothetical protein